ncbi:MAG: SEC-C domain-containing protein [Parachlamydiales bacterium]|nr:SEC-C domain-containing protein [Parachlamydiales bacterium]
MNTSAPGRNDPCPCGSGLKYKKCCISKPPKPKFSAKVIRAGGQEVDKSATEQNDTMDLMKRFNEIHTVPETENFEMTKKDFRITAPPEQ